MKYLLLVIYLFSATSFASHCNAGASHDDDHKSDASHSEMKEDSKVSKDNESNETEVKEDKES